MSEIKLATIMTGDEVRLRDKAGNVLTADAHVDYLRKELFVLAWGTRIYFGRQTRAGWQQLSGIVVIAHQPSLFSS